jgi:hypothetical protein
LIIIIRIYVLEQCLEPTFCLKLPLNLRFSQDKYVT